MSTTPTTTPAKQITAAEVEQLRKDAALAQQYKAAGIDPDKIKEENEALKKTLAEQAARERQNNITEFRARLDKYAREEALNLNMKFNNAIPLDTVTKLAEQTVKLIPDGDIEDYLFDKTEGFDKFGKMRVKEDLFASMKAKAEELESFIANHKRNDMLEAMSGNVPMLNTLPQERRQYGQRSEMAYWSDENRQKTNDTIREQMMNFLLTTMLKKPIVKKVYPDGTKVSWLDEHRHRLKLDKLIKAQRFYDETSNDGHIFSRGGRLFNLFNQEDIKNRLAKMFISEANEMTTANTVGTGISNLALDATTAVILGTWPRLLAKRIAAKTGVMTKTTKRIREIGIPRDDTQVLRQGQHFFGAVDSDTPAVLDLAKTLTTSGVDATDDGALVRASGHIPQDVYALVGEVVDATTTITITGTNQNGDTTATATVTILTTDVVGTIKRFSPTFLGDTFLDVTAVSSTGWTDAAAKGEVGIFTPDPMTGHTAGSPAQKARFIIRSSDVSESQYDLQSNITLAVMEDLEMSLRSDDGDGIDAIAEIFMLLQAELSNMIDRKLFDGAIQSVFTSNQNTFNANIPSGEYSDQKWKERLHYYQKDTNMRVQVNSGFAPNWIVWSLYDEPSFSEWLTQGGMLHRLAIEANDPYADGKAQFTIGGCDVYITENLAPEYILHGNNTTYGIHSYDYIPLKVLQGANPTAGFEQVLMIHHRGYHGVPATDKIYGGRAIGSTKVNRR